MYCTAAEVYEAGQLTSSIVAEAAVNNFILAAEKEVNRLTFTTYFVLSTSGTSSEAGTDSTLVDDSQTWDVNGFSNYYVWIYSGTGSGQVRQIASNTADTLTTISEFTTPPDETSKYRIVYTASNPNIGDEKLDGTGTSTFFVPEIPILDIESLDIYTNKDSATTIDLTDVYTYKRIGKLILSDSADYTVFDNTYPQSIDLQYSYGVYPIPEEVKRYVIVAAAERMLSAQMGATYNVPSTYSLPEGSVTIGQAYINIDSTAKRLYTEKKDIAKYLVKYVVLA